ncbi:T9SS type A sorting domain-containing protein [Algibacter sp. AS12]|uniref:T9SS type A sorting domain-containing protein n=1 Tax=Algibacter sp. AS12 TaxID=3135773 RepID=UPI00398B3D3E
MKKITLLFCLLTVSFGFSQALHTVDFEPAGTGNDWSWTISDVAPSLQLIANPVSGGINTSATVVEFIAYTTDQNWALAFTSDDGQFVFDATNSTVKIMVYKPTISNVGIKFEGLSSPIELKVANTVINQWEELTFDFSAQIGNTYDKLVIIPDFVEPYVNGKDRTTDNTLYFDNIQMPNGELTGPLPEPSTTATAPGHDEVNNQVISIFSDTYSNVTGTNYDPSWGQSTDATIEMVAGEEVLKYAGLNYQGTEYTSQDVSGLDKLHVDYWTANGTTLDFYLISAGNETAVSLPISSSETWLSIDIDLSSYTPPVVLTEVVQFKVVGNGTVWLDNLYFYNSVSLGVNDIEVSEFSIYPNPTQDSWTVTSQNQNITSIQVFDVLGKQVVSYSLNNSEVTIDGASLKSGLYFAQIKTSNSLESIKLIKK